MEKCLRLLQPHKETRSHKPDLHDHQEKDHKHGKMISPKSQHKKHHQQNRGHHHDQYKQESHQSDETNSHNPCSAVEENSVHHHVHDHDHHKQKHHHVADRTCQMPVSGASSSTSTGSTSSSSSSSSSSTSSSSDTSSTSTSTSSSTLSAETSSESFDKHPLRKPQHSQSCTDISRRRRAFEEGDDTIPLINDEGNLNKEKQESGKSSHSGPVKGTLTNKRRKAKSMESLSRPEEREGHENEDDDELERRKNKARNNLVKEKLKFSAFLNEITRQVLSPLRLTSLGVTDAHRPCSPGQASVRSRKTDSRIGKHRQQRSRPGSADSVSSSNYSHTSMHSGLSKHSHSSRHSHSKHGKYMHHQPTAPPHHVHRSPRSCPDMRTSTNNVSTNKHYQHYHQGDHYSSKDDDPYGDHNSPSHHKHHGHHHSPTHHHRDYHSTSHHHHHGDHHSPSHHHHHGVNCGSAHHTGDHHNTPHCPHHEDHHSSSQHYGDHSTPNSHHHPHEDHHPPTHHHRDQHSVVQYHGDNHSPIYHHGDHHHNSNHPRKIQHSDHEDHIGHRSPTDHGDHHIKTHQYHPDDHHKTTHQHYHGDHHKTTHQHHHGDYHSPTHQHPHGDHHSSKHHHQHGDHHSPTLQHHHRDHHTPKDHHQHEDHLSTTHPHHHGDHHSQTHQHYHGDHHSPTLKHLPGGHHSSAHHHHHRDYHSSTHQLHHGDHHSPKHHQGDDHESNHNPSHSKNNNPESRDPVHSDVQPHSGHSDSLQHHQHDYDHHSHISHPDSHHPSPLPDPTHSSHQMSDHCHHPTHEDPHHNSLHAEETHCLRCHGDHHSHEKLNSPVSLASSKSDSPRNTSSPSSQDEERTSSSLHKDKSQELGRIMILQEQNEGLQHSLMKTAARMECLGEEFMSSQKLLEAELQRTRVDLSNLMEKFKRLHDNYSSSQQTNTLLEQKLHSVAQSMDGERERLNQHISALTEQLSNAKFATSKETFNVTSALHHFQSGDAINRFILPITPPLAQHTDSHISGKAKATGQEQSLGSVPEEEESDWSEMGEETPRLILTGSNKGHAKTVAFSPCRHSEGDGDIDSDSGGEEIVRRHPSSSLQIPHIQFTVHNEILPVPLTDALPAGFKNLSDDRTGESCYRVATGQKLVSPILMCSASLEEIPLTHRHMKEELRGTEAIMNLHHPEDEATKDSYNEIVHRWRASGDRGAAMGRPLESREPDCNLASLQSAQRMVGHFIYELQPCDGNSQGRAEVQGKTGGLPDAVLKGERTQL